MSADDEVIAYGDVQVIMRNYIQNIKIIAPFEALCTGDSAKIQIFTHPEGADDEAELTLDVSNPEVAIAKKSGEVVAFKPGISEISVKSSRAEAKYSIIVKPKLDSLEVVSPSHRVIRTQTMQVQCRLDPPDAYVGNLEWAVDNEAIVSINMFPDRKCCSVRGEKVGHFVITCTDEQTQKTSSSRIQIIPDETHSGLHALAVIATVLGMIFSFWIPVMVGITGSFIGGLFAGLALDFCLPAGIILAMVGKNKAGDKIKAFKTCLTLNLITLAVVVLIAIAVAASY
jgi:hypothetical protein